MSKAKPIKPPRRPAGGKKRISAADAIAVYKCKHCGKQVIRKSAKQWIRSYCTLKAMFTRLVRQD